MLKIPNIASLIIEITRWCNQKPICDHCLRGDPQHVHMPLRYFETLLQQVEYIGCLTITGGEPTTRVSFIKQIAPLLKKYNVGLGSFYMATNGIRQTPELIIALADLYAYCDEPEMCRVDISNSMFHSLRPQTPELLQAFRFTNKKYDDDDNTYGNRQEYILDIGKANENGIGCRNILYPEIIVRETFHEDMVYLNALGYVLFHCDLSYDLQDKLQEIHVDNLLEFYQSLPEGDY